MALQKEEERERRVDHLHRLAARRVMQMGLARGWSGWHDAWSDTYRRQRLLKVCAAHVTGVSSDLSSM